MLDLPISEIPLVFIDTETTGLNPHYGDRVVEIALARFRGGVMEDYYVTLVNPLRPIGAGAMRVHGITNADVRDAPTFAEITPRLCDEFADAVLVGHNAAFDLGFVASEYRLAGQALPANLVLDTLTLLRRHFRFPSNGLQRVAEQLGLAPNRAHRALADALTTEGVFDYIVRALAARGVVTLSDILSCQGGPIPWQEEGRRLPPLPPLVEEALRRNLDLLLCYVDQAGIYTERRVSPVGIRSDRRGVYLRAYCHLRQAERQFRLDGIREIRIA